MHNNTARSARDTLAGLDRCTELALRSGLASPRVSAPYLEVLRAGAAGKDIDRRDLAAALREVGAALAATRDALRMLADAVAAGEVGAA